MYFEYIGKDEAPKEKRKQNREYVVAVEDAYKNGAECIVFRCANPAQKRKCYQNIYNMRKKAEDMIESIVCDGFDVYVTFWR